MEGNGSGPYEGKTLQSWCSWGVERSRVFGSVIVFESDGESLARSATGVGILARGLHEVPALGGTRSLAAFVENRTSGRLCSSTRHTSGFNDYPSASTRCGRAKKNGPDQALGRSRGGLSTKIHVATIDENCAVALHVTPGHAHDGRQFESLYESLDPDNVLEFAVLDRGYDADRIRARLTLDGVEPVIPPICTRSKKLHYDPELYRGRNRVERFFNKLKQFRRIATRYDKLAKTFFSAVSLVAAFLILKNS